MRKTIFGSRLGGYYELFLRRTLVLVNLYGAFSTCNPDEEPVPLFCVKGSDFMDFRFISGLND